MPLMTLNVLRNLRRKKATRRHPFQVRQPFENARGELVNDIARCIFCGLCERKCPSACIRTDKDQGLWECDPFACVYCGTCVEVCPVGCLSQKTAYRKPARERAYICLKGEPKKKKSEKDKDSPGAPDED